MYALAPGKDGAVSGDGEAVAAASRHSDDALPSQGLNLVRQQPVTGVVAASAGNHAQGVALAAQKLGVKATIVMPKTTPAIKVNAVKALQAYAQDSGGYCDIPYQFLVGHDGSLWEGRSLTYTSGATGGGNNDGNIAVSFLGCYHPSQQNTQTGRLTEAMLDAVFERARELITRGRGSAS